MHKVDTTLCIYNTYMCVYKWRAREKRTLEIVKERPVERRAGYIEREGKKEELRGK